MRLKLVLPSSLLVLNILDIISTHIGLTYCGLVETNPYYSLPMTVGKIVFPLVLLTAVLLTKNKKTLLIMSTIQIPTIIMYILVVINNFRLILGSL